MSDPDLQADCARCFGLCCIALRLDRADGFGHDKAAGQPCQFLQPSFHCAIHARRQDLGYEGCIDFDCLGAGQRASRQFATQNWQRDPAIAREFQARFATLLDIQHLRTVLTQAENLALEPALEARRKHALTALNIAADMPAVDPKQAVNEARQLVRDIKNGCRYGEL